MCCRSCIRPFQDRMRHAYRHRRAGWHTRDMGHILLQLRGDIPGFGTAYAALVVVACRCDIRFSDSRGMAGMDRDDADTCAAYRSNSAGDGNTRIHAPAPDCTAYRPAR